MDTLLTDFAIKIDTQSQEGSMLIQYTRADELACLLKRSSRNWLIQCQTQRQGAFEENSRQH